MHDVNLQTGFDLSGQPTTMAPSDVSFAVPEEDSSASAGSPTVVVPPGGEKSPFGFPSDDVPLIDQSDSTSESELDVLHSMSPRRVPARWTLRICLYTGIKNYKNYCILMKYLSCCC